MSKRTSASVNPLEKQDGSGFTCSVQLVAVAQPRAAPGSQASLVAFLSSSFGCFLVLRASTFMELSAGCGTLQLLKMDDS